LFISAEPKSVATYTGSTPATQVHCYERSRFVFNDAHFFIPSAFQWAPARQQSAIHQLLQRFRDDLHRKQLHFVCRPAMASATRSRARDMGHCCGAATVWVVVLEAAEKRKCRNTADLNLKHQEPSKAGAGVGKIRLEVYRFDFMASKKLEPGSGRANRCTI